MTIIPRSALICRSFVSYTRPLQAAKVDKETIAKVKEAGEAVVDGAKTVRRVSKYMEQTVTTGAKNVVTGVAKKAFEKATEENVGDKNVWDKTIDATENIKEKIVGK